MKVKVYYNLHKEKFSIQHDKIVLGYCDRISLKNITFSVSEAGRQRVLAEQKKNVHAFASGEVVAIDNNDAFELRGKCKLKKAQLELACFLQNNIKNDCPVSVSYNPYKMGYFYRKENEAKVESASQGFLEGKGIWIK